MSMLVTAVRALLAMPIVICAGLLYYTSVLCGALGLLILDGPGTAGEYFRDNWW